MGGVMAGGARRVRTAGVIADAAASRTSGLALVAAGGMPFAAGAVLPAGGLGVPCPFRAVTGLPCPFCGATRAFALAAHGDGRFLHYGAAWVLVAALLIVAGLAVAATGRRPRPRQAGRAAVLVVPVAWAWALAHASAITTT